MALPAFCGYPRACRDLTERGADVIVIDDPLKPEEALSDLRRESANEWYDHTLYNRIVGRSASNLGNEIWIRSKPN